MKKAIENIKVSSNSESRPKIRDLWNNQINKIKQGGFTCPLCRESFTGIAAFATHLKRHCT